MERFPKKKYMGVWSCWEDMTAVRMRKFPRRAKVYSAENRRSRTFSRPAVSGMPSKVNSVTIVWFLMFIEEPNPGKLSELKRQCYLPRYVLDRTASPNDGVYFVSSAPNCRLCF